MDLALAADCQNVTEGPSSDTVKESQKAWLASRAACTDALDCLRWVYGQRIGQFHDSLRYKIATDTEE